MRLYNTICRDSRTRNKGTFAPTVFSLLICRENTFSFRGVVRVCSATIVYSLFLLCFLTNALAGAECERAKVIEGFKGWYSGVQGLNARFLQKTFNPLWGEEQEATGEVWFRKPGQMRWEYRSPQKDIVVINKEGFFWYVPEDNQVIQKERRDAFRIMSPISILGEDMDLEQNFDILGVEAYRKDPNVKVHAGCVILLKPKMPQSAIEKIRVEVSREDFHLIAIQVDETSGNRNRIEFEEIRKNPEFTQDLFHLTLPPGVKVITPKDFPAF